MWRVVLLVLVAVAQAWVCIRAHLLLIKMAAELNAGRPLAEHVRLSNNWQAHAIVEAYRRTHPDSSLWRRYRRLNLCVAALFVVGAGALMTAT